MQWPPPISEFLPVNGYVLIRADGTEHTKLDAIKGKSLDRDVMVLVADGRYFVRTPERAFYHYAVFREGYKTLSLLQWMP